MKKFILAAIILALTFISTNAGAEGLKALSTDISVFINLEPIRSYTINDGTYVIAEDLADYGFSVAWNDAERALYVTCNYEMANMIHMPIEEFNIRAKDIVIGEPIYDVFTTDIRVFLDGEFVNSYNIDGKTLVNMNDLKKYGYLYWIFYERRLSLDIMGKKLYTELDSAENKQELVLDESTTYSGQVSDGKPNGIGVITKSNFEVENPTENYRYKDTYIGYFKDGEKHGFGTKGYWSIQIRTSHALDTYDYGYYNYENGRLNGPFVSTFESSLQGSGSGGYAYSMYDGSYKDDKLHGLVRDWRSNVHNLFKYKYELIYQGEYIDGVRDNYVRRLLETGGNGESIMAEMLRIVTEKHENGSSLPNPEYDIFCINKYESQIKNGGFEQYFSDEKAYPQSMIYTLNSIKAVKNSEILKKAVEINRHYPKPGSAARIKAFGELEEEFLSCPENLTELQFNYIKENVNLFKD